MACFVKTKAKSGASAAMWDQGGTHFSCGQQRTTRKGKKKHTSKEKQTEKQVPQRGFKEALVNLVATHFLYRNKTTQIFVVVVVVASCHVGMTMMM